MTKIATFCLILFVGCASLLWTNVSCDEAIPEAKAEVVEPDMAKIKPLPPPIQRCCPLDCGKPPINPCPPMSTWMAGYSALQGCPGGRPFLKCQTCACFCEPGYSMVEGRCVNTETCCPPVPFYKK